MHGSEIRALLVHGVAVDNGARADVVESRVDGHGDRFTDYEGLLIDDLDSNVGYLGDGESKGFG